MSNSTQLLARENGAYIEKIELEDSFLESLKRRLSYCLPIRKCSTKLANQFAGKVLNLEGNYSGLDKEAINKEINDLKLKLRHQHCEEVTHIESFALIRELADRCLGLRHHKSQLIGGWALLHGWVAEMETGEGKTLMATLAAATQAMRGLKVHVITVNDYLAQRDADWMAPVYEALGLKVGVIQHSMQKSERQQAYNCEITYCSNKEVAFDYLRDRLILGSEDNRLQLDLEELSGKGSRKNDLLLQGLEFAVVDEADSVLVDEACVPLILSQSQETLAERHCYELAFKIVEELTESVDYAINKNSKSVELTENGKSRIKSILHQVNELKGVWQRRLWREDTVLQCLRAKLFYFKDKHYLVRDQKIEIIDENTGRTMPDRTWSYGIHQAIEVKEKCPVSKIHHPLAKISYQKFFRKYLQLSGMTGTASEVRKELAAVYDLGVLRIPPHVPSSRKNFGLSIVSKTSEQLKEIIESIQSEVQRGRSVLIGVRSVADSEKISTLLSQLGLPHRVLNARNDREEAAIIANAGALGQITVATPMAGRGTDIRLSEEVRNNGGLHVIVTDFHEERRVDRQLIGRCGRQGDPGSYQSIVSLEAELLENESSKVTSILRRVILASRKRCPNWIGKLLFRNAQRNAEFRLRKQRHYLLKSQDYIDSNLTFAGPKEGKGF